MEPYSLALLEGKRTRYVRDRLGRFAPTSGSLSGRAGVVDIGDTVKTPKGALNGVVGTAAALGALGVLGTSAAGHAYSHASFAPKLVRGVKLARRAKKANSKALMRAGQAFAKEGVEHMGIAAALGGTAVLAGLGARKVYKRRRRATTSTSSSALGAALRGAGAGAKAGAAAGLGGAAVMAPLTAGYLMYHEKRPNPGVAPTGKSKKFLAMTAAVNSAVGPLLIPPAGRAKESVLFTAPVLVPAGAIAGGAIGAARGYRNYRKNRIKESGMEPYSLALLEGKRTKYIRDKAGRFASTGSALAGRAAGGVYKNTFDHEVKSATAARGALKKGSSAVARGIDKAYLTPRTGKGAVANAAVMAGTGVLINAAMNQGFSRVGGVNVNGGYKLAAGLGAGLSLAGDAIVSGGALKKRAGSAARKAKRLAGSAASVAGVGLGAGVGAVALGRRALNKTRQGNAEFGMYKQLKGSAKAMGQMSQSSFHSAADRQMMAGSAKRTAALAGEMGGIVRGTYGRAALLGGGATLAGAGAGLAAGALYKRRKNRVKESDMQAHSLELLEFGLFNSKDHHRDKDGKFASKAEARESFAPYTLALLENAKMGYPEQGIPPAAATTKKPVAAKSGLKRKKMAKVATAVAA